MNYKYGDRIPDIHRSAFIAPNATVIGDVRIGEDASIWFHCLLRGDVNSLQIGRCTNIQDGSILHGTYKHHSVEVGDHVTVGHGAILHGCRIENHSLIGMGARVLDGARVGEYSIVAAGTLVLEGERIPAYSLAAGVPAVVKRSLSEQEVEKIRLSAERYVRYKNRYMDGVMQPVAPQRQG